MIRSPVPFVFSLLLHSAAAAFFSFVYTVDGVSMIDHLYENEKRNPEKAVIVSFKVDNLKSIKSGEKQQNVPEKGNTADRSGDKTSDEEINTLRYFEAVKEIIEKNKKYPVSARRRGIEGEVALAFVVEQCGKVRSVRIIHTSGHEILDRSAVENVMKSAPFPEFGSFVSKKELMLHVSLDYRI